jgi:hypothetical protein
MSSSTSAPLPIVDHSLQQYNCSVCGGIGHDLQKCALPLPGTQKIRQRPSLTIKNLLRNSNTQHKKSLLLSTTLPFMDWNEVITFFLCTETIPTICVQDGRLETRMGVSKRDKIWIFPRWRHSYACQLRCLNLVE